jgi:hypothetical protein
LHCVIDKPNTTHNNQTLLLLGTLSNTGHVVFMDRLYTSYKLVQECKLLQQYVCGTCRSDRGFPSELQAANLDLEAGNWDWKYKQGVYAYAWKDSAHCQCLSSFHKPVQVVLKRRAKGHPGKIDRTAPKAFGDYNNGMGGNDASIWHYYS